MDGIWLTSLDRNILDESPMDLNPIDNILNNVEDTVKIVEVVRFIYNFKSLSKYIG